MFRSSARATAHIVLPPSLCDTRCFLLSFFFRSHESLHHPPCKKARHPEGGSVLRGQGFALSFRDSFFALAHHHGNGDNAVSCVRPIWGNANNPVQPVIFHRFLLSHARGSGYTNTLLRVTERKRKKGCDAEKVIPTVRVFRRARETERGIVGVIRETWMRGRRGRVHIP
jgi:hypothetical protein